MRDIAPPGRVPLGRDGVREQRVLSLEPELADPLRAELALLAALGVDGVLEPVHRDLPERRGDRVLDPAGEQVEAAPRIVLVREQ